MTMQKDTNGIKRSTEKCKMMIKNCARCGGDHEITFMKFTRPMDEHTHFGICEVTNEPVVMCILEHMLEPKDVDCVLLIGAGFPSDETAEAELVAGLPFLELSLVNQGDFDLLVDEFFATDRQSVGKGMVEVFNEPAKSS